MCPQLAASLIIHTSSTRFRHDAYEDLDAFEEQMRQSAPSWSAFDIRMMFQGYLERGFEAEDGDIETATKLLGHPLRRYEDFARETVEAWQINSRTATV
jgi:hypothetical protein